MTMTRPTGEFRKYTEAKIREAHKNDTPEYARPGTHVEMIKDRPAFVEARLERFYKIMADYPTFKVVAQSQSITPNGVCIYITYTI